MTTAWEARLHQERQQRIAAEDAERATAARAAERAREAAVAENARLRAARLARLDAEEATARAARDAARVAAVKAAHREAYLAVPGTTEADFEAQWPAQVDAWQRREAAEGPARERAALAASGSYRRM